MIKKEELKRVKLLIQSDASIDKKIGIGLAKEKGMTLHELAEMCVVENWVELFPKNIPETLIERFHPEIISELEKTFDKILKE